MKLVMILFLLCAVACGTKPVQTVLIEPDTPLPPPMKIINSQRQVASEDDSSEKAYVQFFGGENYVNRLIKLRQLARQLHFLKDEKGDPRKRILKKFQDDLDQQIAFLEKLEGAQKSLGVSWLPTANTYQYSAKLRAMQSVKNSADVRAQLENFLAATKVMDDEDTHKETDEETDEKTHEQTFYNRLIRRALQGLADDLAKVRLPPTTTEPLVLEAQFSYASFLSASARVNLRKVFVTKTDRPTLKRVDMFFRQLQQTRGVREAKGLLQSPELAWVRSALSSADYTNSSDIDGAKDDQDTKMATYFGLEMIQSIYIQLNGRAK